MRRVEPERRGGRTERPKLRNNERQAEKKDARVLSAAQLDRAASIARLGRAVQAGTYRPDSRAIAAAMLLFTVQRDLWGADH